MKFLLDRNAVIALLKGHAGLTRRMRQHRPRDFGVPSVVMHELFFGAYKGRRTQHNLARIEGLRFEVVDFDPLDAQMAAELRAQLATAGTPIGPYDILIAGQARARGLILITRNTREFERVSDLQVENWEAEQS